MGADKAKLTVDGVPIGHRIVQALLQKCPRVTVLGGDPIPPALHIPDAEPYAGPIAALAAFAPTAEYVFVTSCDLPRLTHEVIEALAAEIGNHQAAIPELHDRAQPLCALYREDAFDQLRTQHREGEKRIMRWVDDLDAIFVPVDDQPWGRQVTNVNTPEEWDQASKDQPPI